MPADVAVPAAPAEVSEPESGSDRDRLGFFVASLLALLGVLGALVAWRMGDVGNVADNATRDALMARQKAGVAEVSASITTLDGYAAWLDYETARYRGILLHNGDYASESHDAYREAVGHWFSVPAAFLDFDGDYDPTAHREALVAEAGAGAETPEAHLAAAQAAELRAGNLGSAGFILAGALPFLTAAEVFKRRRLRLFFTAAGTAAVAAGIVAMVLAWA